MINQEILRGHWNTIAGAVKEQFGEVTGDDLTRVRGNLDQLIGLLQKKAGQTREQIEQFLNECCDEAESTYRQTVRKASRLGHQAEGYARDGYDELSNGAAQGVAYARSALHRRPLESVAIVAGVSLLAGLALGVSLSQRK